MLVAAVQLELFQMLDDICEAGDMENELFDDLCVDAIQDGRRTGFILMTADLLLSPGSGYKRLLQIRKDQVRLVACVDHTDALIVCVCVCVCVCVLCSLRGTCGSALGGAVLHPVQAGVWRVLFSRVWPMCGKEQRDGAGRNSPPSPRAPCQDRPQIDVFYQSMHDRTPTVKTPALQASRCRSLRGFDV